MIHAHTLDMNDDVSDLVLVRLKLELYVETEQREKGRMLNWHPNDFIGYEHCKVSGFPGYNWFMRVRFGVYIFRLMLHIASKTGLDIREIVWEEVMAIQVRNDIWENEDWGCVDNIGE